MTRSVLFSDFACPYAHRVLATLAHLGVPFDHREAPTGQHPEGLERYSPSGRLPLWVDAHGALGESSVLVEHLAEVHGFRDAWPASPRARALQREAMALADASVTRLLFLPDPVPRRQAAFDECLDRLEAVTGEALPEPSILAFHLAPVWLRFDRWHPGSAPVGAVRARPTLLAWLDRVAALEPVVRTATGVADEELPALRAFLRGKQG